MGWGDCGNDSKGRPIGYLFEATCDEPGCDAKIDRGLAYACGGMHGEDEFSCEGYFCPSHLVSHPLDSDQVRGMICQRCYDQLVTAGLICGECGEATKPVDDDSDERVCPECG